MPTLQLTQKEWNRHLLLSQTRREALDRLYARLDAVDDLIRSLESYQRIEPKPQCFPVNVEAKCS